MPPSRDGKSSLSRPNKCALNLCNFLQPSVLLKAWVRLVAKRLDASHVLKFMQAIRADVMQYVTALREEKSLIQGGIPCLRIVSELKSRDLLQEAAVFPDQVQCGIGLDKLEAMAKCVPVADPSSDVHTSDTQLEVHFHDLLKRQFNRQRSRESAFTYVERLTRNRTHGGGLNLHLSIQPKP